MHYMDFLLLLVLIPKGIAFFFPTSGCSNSCACPTPCPPVPTCAIPLPCPEPTIVSVAPVAPAIQYPTTSYQPGWIPASPVPGPPLVTAYTSSYSGSYNSPTSQPYTMGRFKSSGYDGEPPVFTAIPPENYLIDLPKSENVVPTLMPALGNELPTYIDTTDRSSAVSVYDDTAPALPPPPPSAPVSVYKTTDNIQYMDQSNAPAFELNSNEMDLEEAKQFLHSGETSSIEWPTLPMSRKTIPDGLAPFDVLEKRHSLLKRMRNSKTSVQHTNSTCNSHGLAEVIAQAIVEDVSLSKRMVMRATEVAYDGARFDVFCATGEFSYSIHTRKYCEVTRGNVTCFAFR